LSTFSPPNFRELLTLFHPASGALRVKGVESCTNVVLHTWLKEELTDILVDLSEKQPALSAAENRAIWEGWREGLTVKATLIADLPPLRMLLVMDNLKGHHTPAFLCWLFSQGILPLYTPLGGSWLNMAESIQRIIKRRALEGYYPTSTDQITAWLEAVAKGWNADPTPFDFGRSWRLILPQLASFPDHQSCTYYLNLTSHYFLHWRI